MADSGSEDSGSTALGLGLAIISLLLSTCCCIYKCHKRSRTSQQQPQRPSKHHQDPLREALVSDPHDDRLANRAHVTFRHAAEGANMCAFCGFENLRRFLFCRLCTSALAKPPPRTNASAADDEELVIRETRRPLRTLNVEQRQVRAKLRGEWQRRIDVAGDLFWFRDDAGGFNTSATRFPGFALRFEVDKHAIGGDGRGGAPGSSSKVVVETTRSKQEVVDALYLEVALAETTLVESSRANPAQIPVEDGHLGSLHWRQVLDLAATGFLTKYACFAAAAAAFIVPAQEQLLRLSVSRATLLDDSLEALAVVARGSIRASIHVSFVGDQHHQNHHQRYDEWFLFINHQLAEPAFGVFRGVSNAEQTFYLNANSLHDIGAHHLLHYFAAGRFVGRALLEGKALSFHLALPLLKFMLGLPVSFNDLEYVDPAGYKRLVGLLRVDDAEAIDAMQLHFSVLEQHGADGGDAAAASSIGAHVVDLVPDGRNVPVTNLNKDEYLHRVFQHALVGCVSSQLHAFLKGLYEVVPQELLMLFDPEEFDYVLCGADEIHIAAWTKRKAAHAHASSWEHDGVGIDIGAEVVEGAGLLLDLFDL